MHSSPGLTASGLSAAVKEIGSFFQANLKHFHSDCAIHSVLQLLRVLIRSIKPEATLPKLSANNSQCRVL